MPTLPTTPLLVQVPAPITELSRLLLLLLGVVWWRLLVVLRLWQLLLLLRLSEGLGSFVDDAVDCGEFDAVAEESHLGWLIEVGRWVVLGF